MNIYNNKDFSSYRKAATYLLKRLQSHYGDSTIIKTLLIPTLGIICGSGLSTLSHSLSGQTLTVQYADIPGFPSTCSVPGHEGEIVFGFLGSSDSTNSKSNTSLQSQEDTTHVQGVFTAVFRGRFHGYEGFDMNTIVLPTRVMRCLGIKLLIVTNAAGGLNPDYDVGDIVSIMDHIAIPLLAGSKNPLIGPNDEELGPRFPATSNAYDPLLQQVVVDAARVCNLTQVLRTDGTYCFVSGPNYESKKECQFLRMIGGDAVGMSTVPEIVAAHHAGLKVICLSLITNKVLIQGNEGPAATHSEVLDAVKRRTDDIQRLIQEIVRGLCSGADDSILHNLPSLPPITLPEE